MAERSKDAAGPGDIEVSPPAGTTGTARSPAEMLRSGGEQAIDEAKAIAIGAAEKQRTRAIDALGGVARALHRTAGDLDAEYKEMARYTDMAADKLDQAARYLRQARVDDIIENAENVARRQPWWFIGGAVATGFITVRLLKNSSTTSASRAESQAMQTAPARVTGQGSGYSTSPGDTP